MDSSTNSPRAQHIAILLPSLAGGGAERSMLHLARSFTEQRRKVDLLLFRTKGAYMNSVPESVRVIELEAGTSVGGRRLAAQADPAGIGAVLKPVLLPFKVDANIHHINALTRYMETQRPDVILSALTYTNLAALAKELGVDADVDMPGFVDNPYQYMARAAVFALTSLYEGLPGVIIQALACGCPVVSTDCPGGPAEILENGKYGRLVPVQHNRELADAIRLTLDSSPDPEQLKARAALFSTDNATRQYLDLMENIASHTKPEIAFTADANRNAESS